MNNSKKYAQSYSRFEQILRKGYHIIPYNRLELFTHVAFRLEER